MLLLRFVGVLVLLILNGGYSVSGLDVFPFGDALSMLEEDSGETFRKLAFFGAKSFCADALFLGIIGRFGVIGSVRTASFSVLEVQRCNMFRKPDILGKRRGLRMLEVHRDVLCFDVVEDL